MIIDISDTQFKQIFEDKNLYLPIRWDGNDFPSTLNNLFHIYQKRIDNFYKSNQNEKIEQIKTCCSLIVNAVELYLNGFPAKAFHYIQRLMRILMINPLRVYNKSITNMFETPTHNDPLNLYRVVRVPDNAPYNRTRVFHTPYNMRSKVSTCRYSIAGYPSLYLGTSIELCNEEIRLNPYDKYAITSLFKLERNLTFCNTEIKVIELAVKPQDFFEEGNHTNHKFRKLHLDFKTMQDNAVKDAYLLWYPLIASCSYIRTNKSDPFASEYIIPQLLMQWAREELAENNQNYDQLIGIRYFSCASKRASDMGFNYVFPTSGKQDRKLPFCSVLMKSFTLTNPIYIHEFSNYADCEHQLQKLELDNIR